MISPYIFILQFLYFFDLFPIDSFFMRLSEHTLKFMTIMPFFHKICNKTETNLQFLNYLSFQIQPSRLEKHHIKSVKLNEPRFLFLSTPFFASIYVLYILRNITLSTYGPGYMNSLPTLSLSLYLCLCVCVSHLLISLRDRERENHVPLVRIALPTMTEPSYICLSVYLKLLVINFLQ